MQLSFFRANFCAFAFAFYLLTSQRQDGMARNVKRKQREKNEAVK